MTSVIRFSFAMGLASILVVACSPRNYLAESSVGYYQMVAADTLPEDRRVDSIIKPYREQLSEVMDEVVGEVVVDMGKALPEGGLNNWFADALLSGGRIFHEKNIDVAIQNYGGVRLTSIGAGPITRGKVFEVMPFDNMAVVLELDSSMVQQICNNLARYGGGVVSHTLKFGILEDEAHMVLIDGEWLHGDSVYTFLLPDYVVDNDFAAEIVAGAPRVDLPVLIRDLILLDLSAKKKRGEKIRGVPDGRIYFVND